jgi:MFS family permease
MARNESTEDDSASNVGPWIGRLSGPERSAFAATFAGWMLDGMVFSLVFPTLIALWHITKGQAGLLSTATLLVSSLGGWLAGILADRFGLTENFEQLLLTRSLQGLGFGQCRSRTSRARRAVNAPRSEHPLPSLDQALISS